MICEIRVRVASVEDAISMSSVHANSWKKAYQGLIPEGYLQKIEDTKWVDLIVKGLNEGTMKAWVASMRDKIIGCVCVGKCGYKGYEEQLELISIYVLLEYWHRGAGSILLDEVLAYGLNNDYSKVGLWVLDGNNPAIRFYESKGFFHNGDTMYIVIDNKAVEEKRYIKILNNSN